jgi:hypothetical protein
MPKIARTKPVRTMTETSKTYEDLRLPHPSTLVDKPADEIVKVFARATGLKSADARGSLIVQGYARKYALAKFARANPYKPAKAKAKAKAKATAKAKAKPPRIRKNASPLLGEHPIRAAGS